MLEKLEPHQERVLNLLVDQYEKSPAFRGEEKINRLPRVTARKAWPAYADNFTPVELRDQFEAEMEQLSHHGLVDLHWDKPPRRELKTILAREDAWPAVYRLLRRTDAKTVEQEQLAFFRQAGATPPTRRYARAEAERIAGRKKPLYPPEKAQVLIDLADRIYTNETFLLERELSMAFFHDSKAFEKSWRRPVVELLLQYADGDYGLEQLRNPDSEREKQAVVLAAHHIEANPSYLYMKGDITLYFEDGTELRLPPNLSAGLQTPGLEKLTRVETSAAFVMTVENLTAYHRVKEPEGLCLFLSGFHQLGMEKLLRKIAESRPDMVWRHFGDPDPAGIQILQHLRRRTGLPIAPWHMSACDLEQWKEWAKPLEDHDFPRLRTLREDPEWREAAEWMLQNRLKLEQEGIAWSLYSATTPDPSGISADHRDR